MLTAVLRTSERPSVLKSILQTLTRS